MAEYTYEIETDRGTFDLTLDKPPRDVNELRALAKRAAANLPSVSAESPAASSPSASQAAKDPSLWERYKSGWQGFGEGVMGAAEGLMALPGQAIRAPGQWADIYQQAKAQPGQTAREVGEAGLEFAKGMIPYRETAGEILGGNIPSARTFGRETGGLTASVAIPAAGGRAIKAGTKAFVKELPGAGVELHELAIPKADALAARVQPGKQAVKEAYTTSAAKGNPNIDMGPLRDMADRIIAHEQKATRPNGELIAQAEKILETSETGWSWDHALSEVRRIGEQQREIKRVRGEVPKEMVDLYSALRDNVENANPLKITQKAQAAKPAGILVDESGKPLTPPQPAIPVKTQVGARTVAMEEQGASWLEAQKTARRQFAGEELAEHINKATGKQGEDFNSISVNSVTKWINQQERAAQLGHPDTKARRFVESFKPGELARIKTELGEISHDLSVLPTQRGTPVGSSQRILFGSLGGLIGEYLGGGHGVYGAGGTILGMEAVSRFMQTGTGRALVRRAMKIDPTLGPKFTGILAAASRSGQLGEVK